MCAKQLPNVISCFFNYSFLFSVTSSALAAMSNLRICKAMSLHPSANLSANTDAAAAVQNDADADANGSGGKRVCLMGCAASAAELRRFPVHDINR